VLAAELVLFVAIVGMRAVAQYGPGDKSTIPEGQYGPLFILGNGFAVFFVLSFLAARGGTSAKVAGALGLVLDLALLLKSTGHLDAIATEFGQPRNYVPLSMSGSYSTAQASVLSPALQTEISTDQLPATPTGSSPAAAQKYAQSLLGQYGLVASQFPQLVLLWNQESGWNYKATNPGSGAYGIPQALPASKLPGGTASTMQQQIQWGLAYIKQRYGSIAAAWAHEQHFGWY
jgi:hypothetical protein